MYPVYGHIAAWWLSGLTLAPIVRGTYSRRVNDVGRCEFEILSPLADIDQLVPYSGRGFFVLYYRGRIEDAFAIMDYERTRFGTIRIYGENLAYLLRDYIRDVPTDSSLSELSGDYSQMMHDVSTAMPKQPGVDFALWKARPMRCGFSGSVKAAWQSVAATMTAISAEAVGHLGSRYHLCWYVRTHKLIEDGRPVASTFIVIPRYRSLPPSLAYCESVRVEYSSAYSALVGLGKGMGTDREVSTSRSAFASPVMFYMTYRETQLGRPADTAAMAQRQALYASQGRISGTVKLAPNLDYFNYFELGDILQVQAQTAHRGSHASISTVEGSVREIRGEIADGVVQHTIELGQ